MEKLCCFILLIIASAFVKAQTNEDSVAIVRLLENESATWRSGDIKGHADCWIIKPYSRIIVSTADGKVMDVPPALMINPPKEILGKGGKAIHSNYKMSINGTAAWVSHDEESTAADGVKTFSSEFRMLEKTTDGWKLVGQSIHIYVPSSKRVRQ